MKSKILFFLLVFILSLTAKAQVSKGNWMFGGDAIIQGYKLETSEEFKFYAEVFPKAGYFIKNQFAIGSEIGIFINKATFYSSLVPFGRYYIFNNDKIFNPFIEAGLGFKNISYRESNSPTLNEFMYHLKLGTSLFFTNSAALNLTLNYKRNSFQFDQELSVALGFMIHLERR